MINRDGRKAGSDFNSCWILEYAIPPAFDLIVLEENTHAKVSQFLSCSSCASLSNTEDGGVRIIRGVASPDKVDHIRSRGYPFGS